MAKGARQQKRPNVPILMYHEVTEVSERKTNPAYRVSADRFRSQMGWLRENDVRGVSMDEILVPEGSNLGRRVCITFDDGWDNNYTEAFPVLRQEGIKATLFVVTGAVGTRGYLNWGQAEEMERGGVSIQSHTMSHRPLVSLAAWEIASELERSKRSIEDHLAKRVDFLSVPHGLIDRRVVEIGAELGYRAICTSAPGFLHRHRNGLVVLNRINISHDDNLRRFAAIVEMDRREILRRIISSKVKSLARRAVGYGNYRRIYDLLYR